MVSFYTAAPPFTVELDSPTTGPGFAAYSFPPGDPPFGPAASF